MTDEYDSLADEEAQAAGAEAGRIGGRPTRDLEEDLPHDPAFDPVYEAGGGEAEGWEMAEEELIEHSEHGPAKPGVQIHVRAETEHFTDEPDDRDTYGEADRTDRQQL